MRESVEEVVGKRRVPSWTRTMGAPLRTRRTTRKGRAGSAMPLHVAKVRSNNRGPEGVADERARKPGRRERDVTEPSRSFQKPVLEEQTVL